MTERDWGAEAGPLADRHRIDIENQARWTAGALARPNWGTVTVGLLPRDGTHYEVVLSERVAPDGRRTDGIVVSVLRAGSAAYVWHPGGYVDPIYVAQSWRLSPHTAAILAHFLTKLGEQLAADGVTPTEPEFVDARKFEVVERMRDEAKAAAAEGLRLLARLTAERDDPERRLREVIRDADQLVLGEWDHWTSVGALAGYNGLTATARATLAHLHGRHDDSPLPTMHCVICAAFRSAAGVTG